MPIEWSEVLSETRDFNFARTVYYPLHLAKRMLDTPIPDSIIDDLKPEKLTFLEKRKLQRLDEGVRPVYAHAIVYLAVQKGWYDKLRFLYRCFFPSLPEHRPATFVYLAKRVLRGLRRCLQLEAALWRK